MNFTYSNTQNLGFTFVCIRKNASTSIASALYSAKNNIKYGDSNFPRDLNLTDIYLYTNKDSIPDISDTFNFICVRNPFDRVVSLFMHKVIYHPNPNEPAVREYFDYNPKHDSNTGNLMDYFDDFLTFLEQTDLENCNEHIAYQYSCGAFDTVRYDRILDFGNIDWKSIQQRFDILPDLPEQKIHETNSEVQSLQFKPIFGQRVRQIYKTDYDYFGFDD